MHVLYCWYVRRIQANGSSLSSLFVCFRYAYHKIWISSLHLSPLQLCFILVPSLREGLLLFFFVHSVVFSFHFNEIDDYRNCVIYLINCNILLTPECRLLRERRKVLCCLLAIQNCDSFLRHKQNLCRLFFHFFRAFHLQHFKPFEQSQALYSCSSDFFCLNLSPFLTLSFSLLFIRVLFYCSLFIQRHARCIYFLHIY